MLPNNSHANNGVSRFWANVPKSQRIPSLLSSDRIGTSGHAAVTNHETRMSSNCATTSVSTK